MKWDIYENTKIYKIVCNVIGEIYVGSTYKRLCQRLVGNVYHYKKYLKWKINNITSFEIINLKIITLY